MAPSFLLFDDWHNGDSATNRHYVVQHMAETFLRKIVDSTGKHRVLIVQRTNGSYGWEVEYWSDEPLEQCWVRRGQYPYSICDSEEVALREALGRVEWLATATGSAG